MTCVRFGVRCERKPKVLNAGLAGEPLLLFRHRRSIRCEERSCIENLAGDKIARLHLLDGLPRFVKSLQGKQAVAEVVAPGNIFRGEAPYPYCSETLY